MKKLQVLSFILSFILFIPFITFAYTISSEDYKYYTEKLINVTGNKNITNYYKIDNSSFCGTETENITNYYKIDNSSFCGTETEGYYDCSYKFLPNKPLKLSGTLTVSNFYNYKWVDDESGKPFPFFKTSFKADSGNFNLDNLFIVPLNYKLNTVIPKSYLQNGIAGEISFQADFVLDKDAIIQYGSAGESIFVLYVKDLNINSVKGIKYYDYSEMINTMNDNNIFNSFYDSFFVEVTLVTDDKFVNVRESPNGKIIHKINVNSENYKITHQVGYLEPNEIAYDFHLYYNFPPRNLFYSWFTILKPSKSVFKDWYFITCTYNDGKVVRGFIHSSQIDFYDTSPAYDGRFYEIFNNYTNNISDLNKLSNDEITDLFYNILEESSVFRISYDKNDDIIQLLNRCISYALSDKYKLRNMNIVRSFYNFYDDDTYYKLLDKYIKDYDENYSYYE